MSALNHAVNVYRQLGVGDPNDSGVVKERNVILSDGIINEISALWESSDADGINLEVKSGTNRLDNLTRIDTLKGLSGKEVDYIELKFRRTEFYASLDTFVNRCNSLNHGELPADFFIADINYCSFDEKTPRQIKLIQHFCELINLLKETCHFLDKKEESVSSKAVFVVTNDDKKSMEPVYIDLSFTPPMLECDFVDLSALREIIGLEGGTAHKEEKLSTFRVSVWEILTYERNSKSDLHALVKQWDELLDKYFSSYELYIRGFSFTKFQNEVHEFLIDRVNKANELLGAVANKVAIVPSLFSVWLLVIQQKEPSLIVNLGLTLVATFALSIIVMVLDNQHFMIDKIKESASEKFDLFKRKAHSDPEVISKKSNGVDYFIEKNNQVLLKRLKKIVQRLIIIRLVAWLFLLAMCYGVGVSFWPYNTSFQSIIVIISIIIICLTMLTSVLFNKSL